MKRYRWMSRGARQNRYDLWHTKPVMVNGNFRNQKGPESPKRYFFFYTVPYSVARQMVETLPAPGEVVRI